MFEKHSDAREHEHFAKRGVNFVEPEEARWRVVGTGTGRLATQKRSFISVRKVLSVGDLTREEDRNNDRSNTRGA